MTRNAYEAELGTIRIGVSACLLGAKVRFDGGHKRDRFVDDVLREYFEFVPFCPEVAIGMGTPRETIRLVGDASDPRAVGNKTAGLDVTRELRAYGQSVARDHDDLCGFIFKRSSPSCGMDRVKVYNANGMPDGKGRGLFADEWMQAHPLVPVEEEGRLHDAALRENFITRVFVYARWRALVRGELTTAGLQDFHARHKLLIMVHSPEAYRRLGRLAAMQECASLQETATRYIEELMAALQIRATRERHVNVLHHLLGYLRRSADVGDREDLLDAIESYRKGDFPLVVPIRLLHHAFRRHPDPYVSRQVYLEPHPQELGLRNAV